MEYYSTLWGRAQRGRRAARVQRVQRVQKVQKVVVAAPPQFYSFIAAEGGLYDGAGGAHSASMEWAL